MNHLYTVLPTKEGIEQLRKHLTDGNQAVITTYGRCMCLTKKHIDYVSLSENGKAFLIGYGRKKQCLLPGYLKLVEPGYEMRSK